MTTDPRCDHRLVLRCTSLAQADWDGEPFRGQRWTCSECSTSVYARTESEALQAITQHHGSLGHLVSVEASDRAHARAARARVVAGALRGAALLELLSSIPFLERDAWVDALLGFDATLPDDGRDLPRGAVPYLACGVDEIVAMVQAVPLRADDVLVDVGSGLGRVLVLAHLLSGATARGVEIQAHLVAEADATCAALALERVSTACGDASEMELDGSVFFFFAPCNGAMLARVLERVQRVAARRAIVVCAVGVEFRDLPWLVPRAREHVSLCIYDARPSA